MSPPALRFALLAAASVLAAGCSRTGLICVTATDCAPGQTCSASGCVDLRDGGFGGGAGGGMGGGVGGGMGGGIGGGMGGGGGGMGGGFGGGIGGGIGGGGGACGPRQTQCTNGCKELGIDLDNCGQCGRPCAEAANATATCSGGTCGLRCAPGFADCDLNPMNGCEANFQDPATCGACQNRCPSGANSAASCSMGVCGLTCAQGFGNCDFFAPNGCEADLSSPGNCGTCGNLCRTGPNQVATCFSGMCGAQCRPGFADCDMFPGSGCEANLGSPATCGGCSNACPGGGPNTVATCAGSTCGSQCRPGFGDCNGFPGDGCEADLNSNATCGSCTITCPVGQPCGGGTCGGMACPAPAVGVLPLNTTVMGMLPVAAGRFPVPTCSMNSQGYEDLWTLTITTATTVTLETGGSLDTVLVLRATCSATSDLGCNDDTPGINVLSRVTTNLQPGTYSVFVKEWGGNTMGGAYSLSATVGTATSNAVCSSATQLVSGVPVSNQSTTIGVTPSTACLPNGGGQLFYRVDVPPGQRAVIMTTGTSPFAFTVRTLSSCTATSCLGAVQGSGMQLLNFDNVSMVTQLVIVSVSPMTPGANGTFDIVANLTPLSSNVTCAGATQLTVNGPPISGEVIDTGGPPLSSCLPGQAGRTRYYSVLVPARGAVTVTASPNSFDLGLRVFTSCGATATCAEFGDSSAGIASESLRITNAAVFPQNFIVAASSSFAGSGGTFGISAATSNPAPASNAFCNTPTAIPSGVAIAGELVLPGGMPLTNSCLPTQSGYVRYYSVVVPPGNTLQAIVSPGTFNGMDVGARVLTSCASATCAGSSDTSIAPVPEVVVVSNSSAASQTFIIAASSVNTNPTALNNFSVLANVNPTAANATCAGATTVLVGQTIMGETLAGGGAPNTSCLPAVTGLTKYYRVQVAAGERVAITAMPANFDVSVRVLDSCAATSCVASADAFPAVQQESVTVQNDGPTAKTYVISVSAPATTTAGTFALRVLRTPYSKTVISANCNDLSMAPDLLGDATNPVISDDIGTATLALPFSLSYFASPVTHYAVCMNGFTQLFPNAMGVGDCSWVNEPIPGMNSPNGLVAPLWDDLFPVMGQTRIRSQLSGTMPTRAFTIEWFDAAFLMGPERLRFQAKLFEGTGVIEFHYCLLQLNGGSNDTLTGGSATIGLENTLGTEAMQHSNDTPNSISSGGGLRFVPQ